MGCAGQIDRIKLVAAPPDHWRGRVPSAAYSAAPSGATGCAAAVTTVFFFSLVVVFLAVFFGAALFTLAGLVAFAASAFCRWNSAHRFRLASTMRLRPAALSFRLGLGALATAAGPLAFAAGSTFFRWNSAHRFRVASAMRFRPAALILRFGFGASAEAGFWGRAPSNRWTSAMWASIQAIAWWDFSLPAFIQHGGLLAPDLRPKEDYRRLGSTTEPEPGLPPP